ncbi:putative membrane transport protein [Helianthus anomalus]
MGFVDLFSAASMPVLKVLIDSVDILGQRTRKQVNDIVFFVFSPSLVGSNLAKTITLESIISMWFMPVNILLTYIIGSALGWMLLIITRPPQHLKGLILGTCAAGNLGSLPLIIIPAVCKEKGSPFGDPSVCHEYGMAYASLSMAIGAIFLWTYVYNLVRVFSVASQDSSNNVVGAVTVTGTLGNHLTENLLPLSSSTINMNGNWKVTPEMIKQHFGNFSRSVTLKAVFAPSTTGAVCCLMFPNLCLFTYLSVKHNRLCFMIKIVGFMIGTITPIRKLLIGTTAPLRVIQDSASLVGDASIPTMTLIVGGNLLRGLKGSGVSWSLIMGIVVVRLILLPLFGILIIKGAIYFSLVHVDPLYLFVLLLQYALPPAMNIGMITQLFGAGETECSVIMLWTYGLASFSLTFWSMFFMWFVA